MNDLEMLDSEQVAHLLGCSVRTVFRMVQKGELPAPIRFSRKLTRWDGGTLRRWMIEKGATPIPAGRVPAAEAAAPPAAPAGEPRRLYSTKQLARLLQVSVGTVYRRARRLGLEARAVGRGFAVTDAQMQKLLAARVLPSGLAEAS